MRVLAVGDEAPALEDLVYLLRSDPRIAHVERSPTARRRSGVLHRAMDAGQPLAGVFLDIRMPGLDGLDLARVLSRFAQPPPVCSRRRTNSPRWRRSNSRRSTTCSSPCAGERLAESVHRIVHEVWDSKTPQEPAAAAPVQPSNSTPPEMGDEVIPVELGGVTRFIRLADWSVEAHDERPPATRPAAAWCARR